MAQEATPIRAKYMTLSRIAGLQFRLHRAGLLSGTPLDAVRGEKAAAEDENGRLRKAVADLTFDKEMLQEVIRRKL